jgi:flagellar M-ring protein FliF
MTRTVRNEVREMGGVKRLSVAVALNFATRTDESGAAIGAPRTEEELARITGLVRSAVGYNAARGDQVNVVEAPFQPLEASAGPAAVAAAPQGVSNALLMRAAEIGALALVALALIVFVLRPMLARPAEIPAQLAAAAAKRDLAAPVAQGALPAPAYGGLENLIDLADGKVKASSMKRVAEVVKSHTEESAGILKSWIRQAS